MTEQRRSYVGECVDVGVDVHKETYTVTCVCHKQIVKTATVQAEPASLAASLRRWFPGATLTSAYEAGFSAFVLHRALTQAGISNLVVNPASLAVAANDKVNSTPLTKAADALGPSRIPPARLATELPYAVRPARPIEP
jgi:transposase